MADSVSVPDCFSSTIRRQAHPLSEPVLSAAGMSGTVERSSLPKLANESAWLAMYPRPGGDRFEDALTLKQIAKWARSA